MKKVLLIMAAALMTMTQCRKQETMPVTPSANTIKMTVTAGPGRTSIDTETGAITWSAGDKLYVSDGTNWLGSLTLIGEGGSSQGLFTGNVAIGGGTTPCHFFYLGHDNGMTEPTAGTGTDAVISLASQDGTLAGAMKYHAGYGRTDVTVESGECEGYVVMNTKIAIAHINFTTGGTTAYTGSVTMGGTGISNTLTVSPAGIFSGSGDGGIAIDKGDGTTGERFVTLIPTGETSIFVAFTGDATGSMAFANGIVENKFYGMKDAIAVTLEAAAPVHEYVDLGLPSGLKWATCNVGADSPEDYGNYFAWGETETKDYYDWSTYKWCNGDWDKLTKYNTNPDLGTVDNKTTLELSDDDAARANWGGDWRMPTSVEWQELVSNTYKKWEYNYAATGVSGFILYKVKDDADRGLMTIDENWNPEAPGWVTYDQDGNEAELIGEYSTSDAHLFLPTAGSIEKDKAVDAGSIGYYWSSSLDTDSPDAGRYLSIYSENFDMSSYSRCSGFTVRPVQ